MKARFTTVDLVAAVAEIAQSCIGLRVSNVYDMNNKTYLIRLHKSDHKVTLLFESGIRLHLTDFDWPKNITPSGFSMKLRKHIKNKRLEQIQLVGIDRVVRLQFGTGEWTFHLIVELYDKGNALLTDHTYTIVHLLRPRTDATDQTKIVTSEKYQLDKARQAQEWNLDAIVAVFNSLAGEKSPQLAKAFTALFPYGGPFLDHCLRSSSDNALSLKSVQANTPPQAVLAAFQLGERLIAELGDRPGDAIRAFVTTKPKEVSSLEAESPSPAAAAAATADPYKSVDFLEFHPMELRQTADKPRLEFPSFNKAVDEFFLKMESQKIDQKSLQQEKAALKKLENIKQDHEKRLAELAEAQITDREKGELVQTNLAAVERALLVINSALANQLDWEAISELVASAKAQGDPVAGMIQELRLDKNAIVLRLSDPFDAESRVHNIEVDLGTSAYGNVKRLFDQKKQFAAKEEKTKQASEKALKAADRKTHELLKEAQKVNSIAKVRKPMWFEKFYWFISSENYLIIGGRDQQQNELVVKRHLKAGDLYVHADLHGASSVVIKNPSGAQVPPKTLNEAGQMSVVYSGAWAAKIVSNAWWVHHHQVSKMAPTGEYLTTGSFMIRGKKNYLPSAQLTFGFGFLFRIDEESVPNHRGERAVAPYATAEEAAAAAVAESSEFGDAPEGGLPALPEVLEFADEADEDDGAAMGGVAIRYEYAADGRFEVARQNSAASSSTAASASAAINDDSTTYLRQRVDSVASTSSGVGGRRKIPAHERRAAKKQSDRFSKQNSHSDDLEGDSQLGDLEGNSQTEDLEGNPQIGDLEGNPQIGDLEGDSQADDLERGPETDDIEGNPRTGGELLKENPNGSDNGSGGGDSQEEVDTNNLERGNPPSEIKREPIDEAPALKLRASPTDSKSAGKFQGRQNKKQEQQQQQQPLKRGQRSKLKKMRDKYKDQDDEDKRLAMHLLQSEGKKPQQKQQQQKQQQQQQQQKQQQQQQQLSTAPQPRQQQRPKQNTIPAAAAAAAASAVTAETFDDADDDEDNDDEEGGGQGGGGTAAGQDAALLESLTGQPLPEDILLFAIPVCAPVTTLTAYKFKAKLTPGTAKRGKAVKTALAVFTADKACSRAERDLLRAVKDNELCCNLPGKVKLSLAGVAKQKR